jgi:hypothetical protein
MTILKVLGTMADASSVPAIAVDIEESPGPSTLPAVSVLKVALLGLPEPRGGGLAKTSASVLAVITLEMAPYAIASSEVARTDPEIVPDVKDVKLPLSGAASPIVGGFCRRYFNAAGVTILLLSVDPTIVSG